MAIGRLVLKAPTVAGVAITTGAAATATDGDKFQNDGRTYLEVINGSASSTTVTIKGVNVCNQGVLHDATVTVGTGATTLIGPFNPNQFNDGSGDTLVICSPVTTITLNAIRA